MQKSDQNSQNTLTGEELRIGLLERMLVPTGRGAVPLRGRFIQIPREESAGERRSMLAKFTSDSRSLDAYLLIHALASSNSPHTTQYPALTWATAAGFADHSGNDSARQSWSKATTRLVNLDLISRHRRGRESVYTLLSESGDGAEYTRPHGKQDGTWISLPHQYWLDGYAVALTPPEKIMLLICLNQREEFQLPFSQIPRWYGVPKSTAERGIEGLERAGLLHVERGRTLDPRSSTMYRARNTYTMNGIWTPKARKKAMTVNRKKPKKDAPQQ